MYLYKQGILEPCFRTIDITKQTISPQYLISYQETENVRHHSKDTHSVDQGEKGYNVIIPSNNVSLTVNVINKDYEENKKSTWILPHTEQNINALKTIKTPIDSHIYLVKVGDQTSDKPTIGLVEVYQVCSYQKK